MSLINPQNWSESDNSANQQRWEYWGTLFKLRKEFTSGLPQDTSLVEIPRLFEEYMLEEHGIKVGKDEGGNYTADYTVVDEQKFLLYKLKYS